MSKHHLPIFPFMPFASSCASTRIYARIPTTTSRTPRVVINPKASGECYAAWLIAPVNEASQDKANSLNSFAAIAVATPKLQNVLVAAGLRIPANSCHNSHDSFPDSTKVNSMKLAMRTISYLAIGMLFLGCSPAGVASSNGGGGGDNGGGSGGGGGTGIPLNTNPTSEAGAQATSSDPGAAPIAY